MTPQTIDTPQIKQRQACSHCGDTPPYYMTNGLCDECEAKAYDLADDNIFDDDGEPDAW